MASPLAAPGSVCSSRSSWRWAPPTGARCPQPALPLIHRAGLPRCISPGPRARLRRSSCAPATAAPQLCCPRRQLQVSPGRGAPRGRSLPGPPLWRLLRARCAQPAAALNELRPLRQRVSRARAFAYPLPPLAASALWPAVAGSLQPDAAGRGVAPPRRQPAINALDEPRAARWRSARGQRGARASVAPQPRPYLAAARAVLLSLTRRLCLQPDPAIRSRQRAPCIPSHGARPWETAPPFLNTIRTRPLSPWPCVQARPKMTGPCPDRP